jgi:nicotinate-nucleotide adenylyltransferase
MKRIGLYGGTFNPCHLGHLNLAVEMLEKHHLTQILFCPAAVNPHKLGSNPISSEHRLTMLKLAIEGIPQFSILENELKRGPPSYTIDTIVELDHEKSNDTQYFLIIGEDAIPNFHLWHRVHEIVAKIPLLIGMRLYDDPIGKEVHDPLLLRALEKGKTKTRVMDISSTEIRERLLQKKTCRHLVHAKVLDYIYANGLYSVS